MSVISVTIPVTNMFRHCCCLREHGEHFTTTCWSQRCYAATEIWQTKFKQNYIKIKIIF